MRKAEFDKEVRKIATSYGIKIDTDGRGQTETPFGKVRFRLEKGNKAFWLFMQFQEDFDISYFYRYFSQHESINKTTKKWNLLSTDAEYILNSFDERLNNLQYILARDGKVCGKEFKPFLTEIEK